MRSRVAAFASTLLSSLVLAGTVAAASPQGVSIQVVSGSVSARAGSNSQWLPNAGTVSASDRSSTSTATAFASATVNGNAISVVTRATSSAYGGPFEFGLSGSGNAQILVHISAPKPVAGVLELVKSDEFFFSGTIIDIGNDGSPEAGGQKVPVVVDSTGIQIRLGCTASATAPFSSSADTHASVTFVPGPAGIDTTLAPCEATVGGWVLANGGGVRIHLGARTSVTPSAGFFVFALTTQNVVIPPLGCTLGVNVMVPVAVPVGPSGEVRASLRLPGPLPPATLYQQFLAGMVDPQGVQIWRLSNVLAIRLP